jgi:hypothetical protein
VGGAVTALAWPFVALVLVVLAFVLVWTWLTRCHVYMQDWADAEGALRASVERIRQTLRSYEALPDSMDAQIKAIEAIEADVRNLKLKVY